MHFTAWLAIVAMNLTGCALCRGSRNDSEENGHYDIGVEPYTEFEIVITTGGVHTGQIVGLEGDSVVILPRPYWNVKAVRVDIERIQSLEVISGETSSGTNAALGMLFGSIVGAGGAIIPAGLAGSESSTYSDEYDDAVMWTYCAGFAGALCGGLIGFYIGKQTGRSKEDSHFSFLGLTKLEKLRTIASIAGVTVVKSTKPGPAREKTVEEKPDKISLFESECSQGDMRGCFNLGVAYRDGVKVPGDPARAAELFEQSCQGGFMKGCHNLALMHLLGVGVEKDLQRANALFRQACDGGIERACGSIAETQKERAPPESPSCPEGAAIVEGETADGFEKFCARQVEGAEPQRHGPAVVYYPDGKKAAAGSYSEGARHGSWKYWYPDGAVKLEAEYDHGLEAGTWIYYSESGKESSRVEYVE